MNKIISEKDCKIDILEKEVTNNFRTDYSPSFTSFKNKNTNLINNNYSLNQDMLNIDSTKKGSSDSKINEENKNGLICF